MTETAGIVQRTRLAAYAWCESDDAILLCRLAEDTPEPGAWTLPGGGLEFGEDPATGAQREVAEETGLTASLGALIGVRSELLESEETSSGDRVHLVGIVYRGTIRGGTLRDEVGGSTDRAAWIPFGELPALPVVDLVTWARGQTGR
ncbi:MAG TPA: NUDIX domain-containing protein [Candidatus Limnocylindrales bacterium]